MKLVNSSSLFRTEILKGRNKPEQFLIRIIRLFFHLFLSGEKLLYNIVLVSAEQQHKSAISLHIFSLS